MILAPETVQEIFIRLGLPSRFTEAEVRRLKDDNIKCKKDFLVFGTPGDNTALSVLALRERLGVDPKHPPAFFDHPWYLEEPFGEAPCASGWHAVGMDIAPGSAGQPIYYADRIKADGLYLPAAVEVLLMLFLHFQMTGERLLLRKHTWTRDRTRSGRFVSVGAFGRKGVFVSSHEVGYASRGLGICPVVDPFAGE